jgi:predicted Zn-dependent protease
VLLPFSRTQESEADMLGQRLMADAGFDPNEAVTLWQRMAAAGSSSSLAILSDHPTDANRLAALQKALPEVMPLFQKARAEGRNPNCRAP